MYVLPGNGIIYIVYYIMYICSLALPDPFFSFIFGREKKSEYKRNKVVWQCETSAYDTKILEVVDNFGVHTE